MILTVPRQQSRSEVQPKYLIVSDTCFLLTYLLTRIRLVSSWGNADDLWKNRSGIFAINEGWCMRTGTGHWPRQAWTELRGQWFNL